MSTRSRYSSVDAESGETLQVHSGVWVGAGITCLVLLAILALAITTVVILEDTNHEVNRIWKFNKNVFGSSSSSSDDDDDHEKHGKGKCPVCIQPFGPCKKELPELLDYYPCCITWFQEQFYKDAPMKPKRKKDKHDSRWGYEYFDHDNCKGHHMKMKDGEWYEADDCSVTQEDSYIVIESAPIKYGVDAGQLGLGTGIFDTIKSALTPFGSYGVKPDRKIVLQAVIKVDIKFPNWYPYEDDKYDDPRKVHSGPFLWDKHSGMKVGVGFTDKGVWVMHDRMSTYADVASWHSAKRIYDHSYSKQYCIRIIYCSKYNTFTVYINDEKVHVIEEPGKLPKDKHRDMFVYRGGEPDEAYPKEFKAYMMTRTVMDASLKGHDDDGLVKLDDYDYVEPKKFRHDMKDSKKKRVFGQRVKTEVYAFKVDVCEPGEEPKKEDKKHSDHGKHKDDKHSHEESKEWKYEDEWKDDKDWKDDDKDWKDDDKDWKDDDKWEDDDGGIHIERHNERESWNSRKKEKWALSNSEDVAIWAGDGEIDIQREKSENQKHKQQEQDKYSKEKDWEKIDAEGDWYDFQE